uniref:Forkhead box protein O n=1 Tax=Acrobeloides nanus TaxID=290746 RepID=A0A914ENU4_9BILA
MSADFEASHIKTEAGGYNIYSAAIAEYTSSNMLPTGLGTGYGTNAIMNHSSNDSSAPSSTSSSHTRLAGVGCDDSGMSTLSNSGCMLTTNATHPGRMMNYGSPDYNPRNGDEFEDELGPMIRDRSNTWPLRRPNLDINNQTSPLIHDQIPEEEGYENPEDGSNPSSRHNSNVMLNCTIDNQGGVYANDLSPTELRSPDEYSSGALTPPASAKKSTTRRNAWGNMSYADLITQAILSSPEKRLTLSQVYEWMVQNVPYFRDKGDSNSSAGWKKKRIRRRNPDAISQKKPNPWGEESYSDLIAKALECAQDGRMKLNEIYQWFSDNIPYFKERSSQEEAAGWKNSIRHNLSLHSRFMRIQNEGAGKSSWWVINPDAKPGRNPRRRAATMDTTTKVSIDKIRKRNYKKGCMVSRPIHSGQSSMLGSQASVNDPYQDDDGFPSPFAEFRARTQSNLSVTGPSTSRMSPTLDEFDQFDKFDFPPWMEPSSSQPVSELLATETDRMRLESDSYGQPIKQEYIINTALKNQPQQMPQQIIMKMEPMDPKHETGVQPPPSYEELRSVSGQTQMQNPIIRSQLQQQHLTQVKPVMNGAPGNIQYYSNGMFQSTPNQAPQMMGPQGWQQRPTSIHQTHTVTFITGPGGPMMNGGQQISNNTSLPMDLENVMPEHSIMDLDMEAVLRHEASLTRDNQLHFDL